MPLNIVLAYIGYTKLEKVILFIVFLSTVTLAEFTNLLMYSRIWQIFHGLVGLGEKDSLWLPVSDIAEVNIST